MQPGEEALGSSGAPSRTKSKLLNRVALRANLAAAAADDDEEGRGGDERRSDRRSCEREVDDNLLWSNVRRTWEQHQDLRETSSTSLETGRDLLGRRSNRHSTNGSVGSCFALGRKSTSRFSGRGTEDEERVSFRRITGSRGNSETQRVSRYWNEDPPDEDLSLQEVLSQQDVLCANSSLVASTASLLQATGRKNSLTLDEVFEVAPPAKRSGFAGHLRRPVNAGQSAPLPNSSRFGNTSASMTPAGEKLPTLQSVGSLTDIPRNEGYETDGVWADSAPAEDILSEVLSPASPRSAASPCDLAEYGTSEPMPVVAPPAAPKGRTISPLKRGRMAARTRGAHPCDGGATDAGSNPESASSSPAPAGSQDMCVPAAPSEALQASGPAGSYDQLTPSAPKTNPPAMPMSLLLSRLSAYKESHEKQ